MTPFWTCVREKIKSVKNVSKTRLSNLRSRSYMLLLLLLLLPVLMLGWVIAAATATAAAVAVAVAVAAHNRGWWFLLPLVLLPPLLLSLGWCC